MTKKSLIIIILIFLLLAAGVLLMFRSRIFADSLNGDLVLKNSADIDLNNDGKPEALTIHTYKIGNKYESSVSVKNFWGERKLDLSGFEYEANFCEQKYYDFGDNRLLCIIGFVGAHSQNLELVTLKSGKLEAANFQESGNLVPNLVSDQPNFQVLADKNVITADMRNYELDPLKNITRKSYAFNSGVFTFSASEDIVYGEEE